MAYLISAGIVIVLISVACAGVQWLEKRELRLELKAIKRENSYLRSLLDL